MKKLTTALALIAFTTTGCKVETEKVPTGNEMNIMFREFTSVVREKTNIFESTEFRKERATINIASWRFEEIVESHCFGDQPATPICNQAVYRATESLTAGSTTLIEAEIELQQQY